MLFPELFQSLERKQIGLIGHALPNDVRGVPPFEREAIYSEEYESRVALKPLHKGQADIAVAAAIVVKFAVGKFTSSGEALAGSHRSVIVGIIRAASPSLCQLGL